MADLDLPEEGETPWDLNPALESINAEVEGLLAMRVVVSSGSEARPATPFVIWIGGATRPANMIDGDLWFQDENATPPQEPTGTAPEITLTSLNALQVGSAFSQTVTYTGDAATSANIISGAIPGVTVSRSGGTVTLSGTPTTAGSYTVTVQISNASGSDSQTFSGTVAATPVDPEEPAPGGEGTYVRKTALVSPRNGTDTHTVSFAPATAGELLVMVVSASALISVPSGWAREAQALAGTDLSVFTKTASAAESQVVLTLSAPNYLASVAVYAFEPGTQWVTDVAVGGLGPQEASPTLTGLTGIVWAAAAVGTAHSAEVADNPVVAWTGATLDVALTAPMAGNDGNIMSIGVSVAHTGDSFAATSTYSGVGIPSNKEAVSFAVRLP